jgi:hypothetical protein
MDLWELKDALSANEIEDEVLYAVDDLGGLKIKGRSLKQLGLISVIEGHAYWRNDNPAVVKSYYPNMYHWQVKQFDPNELAYEISPEFSDIRDIAKELQLPLGNDVYYRTRIFTGNSFCLNSKHVPDTFRQYTVEALGVKTKPLPPLIAEALDTQLPGVFNYPNVPIYFPEKDSYLTVVWRLRVFLCPIEHFAFSPSSPLAPANPEVLYFERRWHPNGVISEAFKNVEKVRISNPGMFDRFKTDTFFLLRGESRRGRNPNSGAFPAKDAFLKKRDEAREHFGGAEPPIEVLARFFDISQSVYRKYADLCEVPRKLYAKNDEDKFTKE